MQVSWKVDQAPPLLGSIERYQHLLVTCPELTSGPLSPTCISACPSLSGSFSDQVEIHNMESEGRSQILALPLIKYGIFARVL